MDSQVVVGIHKFNLCRDLLYVANQTSFSKKTHLIYSIIYWLLSRYNKEWTSLNLHSLRLGGQTVKNLN